MRARRTGERALGGVVARPPVDPASSAVGSDDGTVVVPLDPEWVLAFDDDELLEGVRESLVTIADGLLGTRGSREEDGPGSVPLVVAAGVYETRGGAERLLEAPVWVGFGPFGEGGRNRSRRSLDMRRGVLFREIVVGEETIRTLRFASLARPGVVVLRAEGPEDLLSPGPALRAPAGARQARTGSVDGGVGMTVESDLGGGFASAARQSIEGAGRRTRVERIAAYATGAERVPSLDDAGRALDEAASIGVDGLLAEHTTMWERRWAEADVVIDGDPELQEAVRFSLFHLMASVADHGEAAVGPRGLSGPTYSGHVFWDADVFVLPFLAATHPASARAMLAYRVARLGAARHEAAEHRLQGAQFPWESAQSGREVAPAFVRKPDGEIVPIRTGGREEHIGADVAWAATEYGAWTGDDGFMHGDGRQLLTETARFWASRTRVDPHDDHRVHLYGVIGPDEYHEVVDDNAYTNVMARWNLRAAAATERRLGGDRDEARTWEALADRLVDGYDAGTGLYEQCAGFYGLHPVLISEIAETPVAADLLLGRDGTRLAQVIKQPDVLMLHHLVPDEVAPGSLGPNLDYYLPRIAHGSSLSPPICASLLARAGRPDEALALFRIACRLDLDNLTGTTAGGLHLATMGGVWQALVYGFAGIRPRAGALTVDPQLPTPWRQLAIRLAYRGAAVHVAMSHHTVDITSDAALDVVLSGRHHHLGADGGRFERRHGRWERNAP
jgi:trehalose/maltose hydrolase-like predicted phosphorylase